MRKQYFTLKGAAAHFGCSTRTIERKLASGDLKREVSPIGLSRIAVWIEEPGDRQAAPPVQFRQPSPTAQRNF
jgi:hypothetical protein